MTRDQFHARFQVHFFDPAFAGEADAISRLEDIAWQALQEGRKAPVTRPAGRGISDPSHPIWVQWLDPRKRLRLAQKRWGDSATPARVLLVCGSARNDGTCSGEVSKTWRLSGIASSVLPEAGIEDDLLDLSLVTSEYGRTIQPCKGCVSSAMPLCHWPCKCYPNHAVGQADDWMAEICERWVVAAKRIEKRGWDYPQHLAGCLFGAVVHGDVAGVESHRRNLVDWLEWMGLVQAGKGAVLDRYVGCCQPCCNSHDALDKDVAVQEEVRQRAGAVAAGVHAMRAAGLHSAPARTPQPRSQ